MSPFNSHSPDTIMRDHFAVEEASGLRPQTQTLKPFGASSAGMGVASVRHHHADIPESASVQGLGLPSREDLLLGLILACLTAYSGKGRAAGSITTTTRQRQVRCGSELSPHKLSLHRR